MTLQERLLKLLLREIDVADTPHDTDRYTAIK